MKHALVLMLLAANAAVAAGQSDSVRSAPDSGAIAVSDTIRVWSHQLKFKGKRGVVSRVEADSLAFMAPAGFRKIPREYVGDLASIERVDVLEGRQRSLARAGGKMLLGGVVGTAGGVLIGRGVGYVIANVFFRDYRDSEGERTDVQPLLQWYGTIIFGPIGAGVGAFGGLIDGAKSYENWRRVR